MAERTRPDAGPRARVTLPDGQKLDVVVTGRTRTSDGRWWYDCEALLYGRIAYPDGTTEPEPAPIAVPVPAEAISRIDGQDYAGVPTTDATVKRPWRLEVRLPPPAESPPVLLHRADCWQGRHGRSLTDQEAREATADRQVGPCTVCHPERAMRR
ncbi:DUF6233 domain-containing protein [Streptomyces sp. NPDC054933]